MRDVNETPRQALQRVDDSSKPSLPSFSLPSLSVVAWIVLVAVILTAGILAGVAISNMMEHYFSPVHGQI